MQKQRQTQDDFISFKAADIPRVDIIVHTTHLILRKAFPIAATLVYFYVRFALVGSHRMTNDIFMILGSDFQEDHLLGIGLQGLVFQCSP